MNRVGVRTLSRKPGVWAAVGAGVLIAAGTYLLIRQRSPREKYPEEIDPELIYH